MPLEVNRITVVIYRTSIIWKVMVMLVYGEPIIYFITNTNAIQHALSLIDGGDGSASLN